MIADTFSLFDPATQNVLLTRAMWWFMLLWLGTLGGCVGSFLTVVWDRKSSDRGIVFPPSECEECGHPIRWYHNLPVVGWLMLGGRCHDCGMRIPVKHPLVEFIFACIFVASGILSPWL